MPRSRQSSQNRYDHILPFLEEAANQYYGRNIDKGFRHWAFSLRFGVGTDLADTDIIEYTAIDGADDFEIDGWYIPESDDDSVINLFQSKHRQSGTTMGAADLAPFLNAPIRILSTSEVAASRNERTKDLHDELLEMLRRKEFKCTINLVWATSGTLSPTAKRHADVHSRRTVTLEIDGSPVSLPVTLECWDLQDLFQEHNTQQDSDDVTRTCDVEFQLDPGTYHQAAANTPYRTLSMTVVVRQIIDAFARHRYKLFRLNPRGPLGNKVNAQIKETLLDQTNRQRFHLLNNGITAICLSWRLDENHKLVVRDFQIINGCQTTVTLWDARAEVQNDSGVMVTVKLAECPDHFANDIAKTTNTQAALKAEDFTSNERVQLRLQSEFAAITPAWFYQVKRGEWSKMLARQEQTRYHDPERGYRNLKSKDVAQAVVAFSGFPGEAKDKIRDFLNKEAVSSTAREGGFSYERLYTDTLSAKQLLLPAMIQRRVWKQVAEDQEREDWSDYARLHIIWLIGDLLREHYHMQDQRLLPAPISEALSERIEAWFPAFYAVAVTSIEQARDETRDQYRGDREFFRTASNYRLIESKMQGALRMARTFGDPTASLPVVEVVQ